MRLVMQKPNVVQRSGPRSGIDDRTYLFQAETRRGGFCLGPYSLRPEESNEKDNIQKEARFSFARHPEFSFTGKNETYWHHSKMAFAPTLIETMKSSILMSALRKEGCFSTFVSMSSKSVVKIPRGDRKSTLSWDANRVSVRLQRVLRER